MEQLEAAFNNVYQTLEMISDYKIEALDTMTETISALSAQVVRAQSYLDKVRDEQALAASEDLILPEPGGDGG
jgi:uncharacterized protein YaaN involved in tellurite resistance